MASRKFRIVDKQGTDPEMLEALRRDTFRYFRREFDPRTGLVPDSTDADSPASIATTGMALLSYIVAAERRYLSRAEAIARTLRILKFFLHSRQGKDGSGTGYKGFYYHFLDIKTGIRAWESELSTVDTAFLAAAMLASAEYFTGPGARETEIRRIAEKLYRRIDWKWACNRKSTITHGWKPETGFLPHRWSRNYSEAHILYILALGSPTHPISEKGYRAWIKTFKVKSHYGIKYLPAPPLFIHQLSQVWLDFRDLADDFNRKAGFTYFENSRRATLAQREYAIHNPRGFARYGKDAWGFTACVGPGPDKRKIGGKMRQFYGYVARGAPHGTDDGTLSPWVSAASLPFAPEIVLQNLRHSIERLALKKVPKRYGLCSSFNPTFPCNSRNPHGWVSPHKYGLNSGPVIFMIENHETGLIWKLSRKSPYIREGLRRAGFRRIL